MAMGTTAAACKESANFGEGRKDGVINCTLEDVCVYDNNISY